MEIAAAEHNGICLDLLQHSLIGALSYDFVCSIGLIEHFIGDNIRTMISRHFEYCKDGRVVFEQ